MGSRRDRGLHSSFCAAVMLEDQTIAFAVDKPAYPMDRLQVGESVAASPRAAFRHVEALSPCRHASCIFAQPLVLAPTICSAGDISGILIVARAFRPTPTRPTAQDRHEYHGCDALCPSMILKDGCSSGQHPESMSQVCERSDVG